MAGRVIAVRVESPGTLEQHITDLKMEGGTVFTRIQMVIYVQMTPDAFFTNADGKKALLIVAHTEEGTRYVKTVGDSTKKNNLLSLPRF